MFFNLVFIVAHRKSRGTPIHSVDPSADRPVAPLNAGDDLASIDSAPYEERRGVSPTVDAVVQPVESPADQQHIAAEPDRPTGSHNKDDHCTPVHSVDPSADRPVAPLNDGDVRPVAPSVNAALPSVQPPPLHRSRPNSRPNIQSH